MKEIYKTFKYVQIQMVKITLQGLSMQVYVEQNHPNEGYCNANE